MTEDAKPLRWGILGTGRIAGKFAEAIQLVPQAKLVAVGSRTAEAAASFAAQHGNVRSHPSYTALAADPDVDAIYIATPHAFHAENAELCLRGGKALLVEKAFTLTARQARGVLDLARAERRFVMEALWSRFLPAMVKLRELIAAGAIGDIQAVQLDFCIDAPLDPTNRWFDPALGGGGLLDLGVYGVSFVNMLLGRPSGVIARGKLSSTGVDESATIQLQYPRALAQIICGIRMGSPLEALILGTQGYIRLPTRWYRPTQLIHGHTTGRDQFAENTIDLPYGDNGFEYQIAAATTAIRAGALEVPTMSHADTLATMEILDQARQQIGVRYPADQDT